MRHPSTDLEGKAPCDICGGLVSTKLPKLESTDALRLRIDEAAQYCPIEQLALSPQCGFSSVARRNGWFTMDQVEAKLARVVETTQQVWG
jgi:5-methyltetrahydropteroyltriglutamate--homocysteine methyltransferase